MVRRYSARPNVAVRRFSRDADGAVAMIFALALIPILALVGAAVDYARASKARTQLQAAVDAATLAAAQKLNGTYTERQQAAYGALQSNLATSELASVEVTVTDTTTADGNGVTVAAQGLFPTAVMTIIGVNTLTIGAQAEALAGAGASAEIALVLDNTGSMVNDMPALKSAASNFVNTVFGTGASNVKMSVVPYVAAVNVGTNFPVASLELTGTSTYHAQNYRYAWVTSLYASASCNAWAGQPPVVTDPSTPSPPPPDPGTPTGNDKTGALGPVHGVNPSLFSEGARVFARSLFGISRAAAQVVTPNSIDPISTTPYTVNPPYVAAPYTAQVPDGYAPTTICWLANPPTISNFDLFNRMPGAQWKGCVEARPDPLDVTDDPPTADPNTHFVPYFAPDERDLPAGGPQWDNNYQSDVHASWAGQTQNLGWDVFDGFRNIMKYDGVNVPHLVDAPPASQGPNFMCPDPLLRLTNVKADILAKINSLNDWGGGGTITSEGLAWGWRTISPNPPFAQGAAYAPTQKKYIVLMTDGMNSLVENRPNGSTELLSEYTTYGYLTQGRLNVNGNTFSGAETFLNDRMIQVCTNAKAKGVSIFTILFRETDPTIASLLQQCASTPGQALKASDAASLNTAFSAIATQVNALRLAK